MFDATSGRYAFLCIVLVVYLTCSKQVAMAEPPQISIDKDRLAKLIDRIKQGGDSFAAMAEFEAAGTPVEVAEHYSQLLRVLYFQEKNVPWMVMIGRGGITYALSQAQLHDSDQPETAARLRGIAKTISYNLGVNCWPGWKDEGIVIAATDLAAGFDAALLNLRLAGELKRDAEIVGNAHWLVGAHHLAQKRYAEAIQHFEESAAQFAKADKADYQLMAEGYAALAASVAPDAKAETAQKFQAAVATLQSRKTEDATFFAEQLQTAAEVFAAP